MILAKRRAGEMSAIVTIQKLKDEPSGLQFKAEMKSVTLGVSKTGRDVSTLVVELVVQHHCGRQVGRSARSRRKLSQRFREGSIC